MQGSGWDRERSLSACVFGNRHRLELLVALSEAPDGRVNLGALADQHGVQASVYYPSIRSLQEIRLVKQADRVVGDRRRWYERCGSGQAWESLARVTAELRRHFAAVGSLPGPGAGPVSGYERVDS
jgi:hypothetical protein